MTALKLFLREYGDTDAAGPPLVMLHGLFGSSVNWHRIARQLEPSHRVLLPDLRNHGRSPSSGTMSYPAMAQDLVATLDSQGIDSVVLAGHSMGGKAAMWLALTQAERVQALVVADIAPVRYPSGFDTILDSLGTLDLARLASRQAADTLLAERLPDPDLRGYLLQNLVREGEGWRWRVNLPVLAGAMGEIRGFPETGGHQYPGPALFLYGSESDYVTADALPTIRALFPHARLRAVSGAGHWVYADRPDAFVGALQGFLAQHRD